jgi:hypothetical protein
VTVRKLTLSILPDTLAVCRLDPSAAIPDWALPDPFSSITRTQSELSIVCEQGRVPQDVQHESGWRCLSVIGQLDFEQIGVFASLAGPLAEAEISIFPIATFDTDHVLVKDVDLARAVNVLVGVGHRIVIE